MSLLGGQGGGARGRRPPGTIMLPVVQVLVVVLFAALLARLWYLQVPMAEHYQELAADNQTQDVVVPATRGKILDSSGRALVRNRVEMAVSADYRVLQARDDKGEGVLRKVGELLDVPYEKLRQRARLCGPGVSRPCWPGSPYQPITLVENVQPKLALHVLERKDEFPGISAQQHSVREYPKNKHAAQVLGYLQPVTQEELKKRDALRTKFSGVDQVGRDGLEASYDDELRGTSGLRRLGVDSGGDVTGMAEEEPPEPGMNLVTSINSRVQEVTERALKNGLDRSRADGFPADSAAGVVMDVRTGRLVAMGSLPSYDPAVWDGGIDQRTFDKLLSEDAGEPLTSRALQGQYPPASTFKVNSAAAALANGVSPGDSFSCPSAYSVGNRSFQNFEGTAGGSMTLHGAITVSCNTVFYQIADRMWREDGGSAPKKDPRDAMTTMAAKFGFGDPTGVDLPNEGAGRVPDRQWKKRFWEQTRESNCEHAKKGYPDVAKENPGHAQYLKSIAEEQCQDGHKWRAGDAVNFSIGQGDVLVTPLQLARAYAAVANGGTLYEPRVGKALISSDGKRSREIEPTKAGKLPVTDSTLSYIRSALSTVPKEGTAKNAFGDFPQGKVSIAGKTGTAQGADKKESAWFASYAPADDPRFAVVVLISQGGTGGKKAAPVAREIYDGIYGFSSEDDKPAVPGGEPPSTLPDVRPDGSVDMADAAD